MLLIVAGLLARATQHALYTNPGFGYEQLLSIDVEVVSDVLEGPLDQAVRPAKYVPFDQDPDNTFISCSVRHRLSSQ